MHMCPVCCRSISRNANRNTIRGHRDRAGNTCPASFESFSIAVSTDTDDHRSVR